MSIKPYIPQLNNKQPQRIHLKENTSRIIQNENWNTDEYFNDIEECSSWETEVDKAQKTFNYNADIYKMGYKEFQCYIYNQLEEVKSILNSILDVVKEGAN